jgi:hypothetical protein
MEEGMDGNFSDKDTWITCHLSSETAIYPPLHTILLHIAEQLHFDSVLIMTH